jgi:2'-5' RNA ligase
MPRLFTALEVPAPAVEALSAARGGIFGARWTDPADYHVTLRFVGDVDRRVADDVAEALEAIRRPPVSIQFDGLHWFGGDKPRAIVARIKPNPDLMELQAEHESRMRRLGLAPETRNFTPHVTLASLRGVSTLAVADYLNVRGRWRAPGFEASRFVLYSARESFGGGPYIAEVEYPLRGRTNAAANRR